MFTKDHTGPVRHRQREIRGDPLLGWSHGHEMDTTLSFVSLDLELDIDATLQMGDRPRDPGPILVCKINLLPQKFLSLGIELDIEQRTADDTRTLTLMVRGDSNGSGPEGDTEDAEKDVQGGFVCDRGEGCGLGFEVRAVTGLVQGGSALESRVGGKL